MVKAITSAAEFDELLASGKKVIVDFHAVWCGPCKVIAPKFQKFDEEFADVEFVKVDVDEVPEIAQKHEVTAMPTFLSFHQGKKVNKVLGANEANLKALINEVAAL
ncbi:Cytoplasmic thioredoxin isoenzyme 2 [Mortierella sp. AD094]|nr:Cytoplasmic thioredoxin isoenzyme 2 [Mortierella sp. AD094]